MKNKKRNNPYLMLYDNEVDFIKVKKYDKQKASNMFFSFVPERFYKR